MLTYVALLIGLFAVMFAVFYIAERQIFAPWSVTLGVWVIVLCLYLAVHEELYAISGNFVRCLTLWVTLFSCSSFAVYKLTPNYKKEEWQPCERNIDILTLITLIVVPFAVYKAVQHAALLGSPAGILATLREQAVTPEENQLGFAKYFVYVIAVLLMIEINRVQLRKKRLLIVCGLCVLFFVATMAKLTLSTYLFSALYLLYANKRITLKPIFFTAVAIIALIPILYFARGSEEESDAELVGSLLMTYSVASLVAFDYIVPGSSAAWGAATFRPVYNVMQGLGFNVHAEAALQDFIYVPMITNVYTVMFPFYKDFGTTGVAVFAILIGAFVGFIYKQGQTGNTLLKYLYAYIFTLLIMQFFDELIMQGISAILQITILLLLCHLKIKFTWPTKKTAQA